MNTKRRPLIIFHPNVTSPDIIWVTPIFYILGAILLGVFIPRIDALFINQPTLFNPNTATSLLSAIFSGMITFTGIVFSMMFLMVQFSSSAYTPRIARYFLNDPFIAHALGVFIATFIYSLIALFEIGFTFSGDVPDFTVGSALILLLASTLMFLLLIRRITSLQINEVLYMIGLRGKQIILALYPLLPDDIVPTHEEPDVKENLGIKNDEADLPDVLDHVDYVGSPRRVVELNLARMALLANKANITLQVVPSVGDMVSDHQKMILVRGNPLSQRNYDKKSLLQTIKLGLQRTAEQDPRFAIRLLVDIAIRALSSSVNDPTTTVQVLDQLDDLLRQIAVRDLNVGYVYDEFGKLRIIYPTPDWDDFLNLSIDEIRIYGTQSLQTMRRLRALLIDLLPITPINRRGAVQHQLERLDATITRAYPDPLDRSMAEEPDRQGISIVK